MPPTSDDEKQWDVFISHASEDKETVARPLADLLRRAGLRVWIDESQLRLGDSLRQRIDHGLSRSSFGVVILSRAFFLKDWPQRELNGLVAREISSQKVILPVWHEIDREFVTRYSPHLADKLAVSTSRGLEAVARAILEVLQAKAHSTDTTPELNSLQRHIKVQNNAQIRTLFTKRRAIWLLAISTALAGLFFGRSLFWHPSHQYVYVGNGSPSDVVT